MKLIRLLVGLVALLAVFACAADVRADGWVAYRPAQPTYVYSHDPCYRYYEYTPSRAYYAPSYATYSYYPATSYYYPATSYYAATPSYYYAAPAWRSYYAAPTYDRVYLGPTYVQRPAYVAWGW